MTILFDLDGTLLPMDQEKFIMAYLEKLGKYFAPRGFDPKILTKAIFMGTEAMINNDGKETNETVFWNVMYGVFGEKIIEQKPAFEEFYKTQFDSIKEAVGYNERSAKLIQRLKSKGVNLVLATNPVFPRIAQEKRLIWTNNHPSDFKHFTSYEIAHYCKPNPKYYEEILSSLGLSAQDCLMVGNDVREDGIAQSVGIKVFILTDNLLNRDNIDISKIPHGGFDELDNYLTSLGV